MKAIAIVGSPRKNGNTEILVRHTLKAIAEEGIETEFVSLRDLEIKPCIACETCSKEERCPLKDDLFPLYKKMKAADAIILASPVYFGSATSQMKALMDRAGYIGYWQRAFEGKVGGAIVVARRAGQNFTFAQLNYWFEIHGCIVPGSTYWNMAIARKPGDVNTDDEGMTTVWNFGKNVARLLKKLKA
jgi:multimeric flavodoxin WrbA